ncbi:MAG: CTP synthase [Planctomycetota bacterium]|jgi:CTP synthase
MPHLPPDDSEASVDELLRGAGRSSRQTEFFSPVPHGYRKGRHKYVVVLGTVMSGLGKGIFSSSLAKLIKDKGLSVAPIKLEGYLNIDSGTLNPYRHGEVFVLADGTECDMDLGTYERMLDQDLSRANFCTSGQVYTTILERERRGGYLGRDVQMIPHVTGEVKQRLRTLAMTGGPDGGEADVVFVEVGGTVGDYENGFYIEALRELAFEEGRDAVCFVALTYVLEPQILGEQKSKAAQLGIKLLMEAGIQPHMIACRAKHEVSETVKQKISMFSNVPLHRCFSMHDRESIYVIPEAMRGEGLDREVLSILDLHHRVDIRVEDESRREWVSYADRIQSPRTHAITLGIAGKYASLRDAYASIDKAIEHASTHLSVAVDLRWMDTSRIIRENVDDVMAEEGLHALIIPGGFGDRGVEGKIACAEHARTHGLPFLGICLGFQCAVIEFARNALGIIEAHSTEFTDPGEHAVISELPEQKRIEGLGGSMRLGAQDVAITEGSLASWLYRGRTSVRERFRHRYEVEPRMIEALEAEGLIFSGRHPEHPIMQVLELPQAVHPYYVAAQFHPELTSRPLRPQPMFMALLAAAVARATPDLDPADPVRQWVRGGDERGEKASPSGGSGASMRHHGGAHAAVRA